MLRALRNIHPRRTAASALLAAAVLAALALFAPRSLAAAEALDLPPPASPVVVVRYTTLTNASQWRRGTLDVATTRALQQRLRFDALTPDSQLYATVEIQHRFDQGLPAEPGSTLLAERQLDASLELASLQWRPGSALHVAVGRLRSRAILGQRVDGAELTIRPHPAVALTLAAGLRPSRATSTLDGDAADVGNERQLQPHGSAAVLRGARAALDRTRGALSVTYADEHMPARDVLLRRQLSLAARAGGVSNSHARLEVTTDLIALRLEQLGATLVLPFASRQTLSLLARHDQPSFALDSIFAIFDTSPTTTFRAVLALEPGPWKLSFGVGARHWWPGTVATGDFRLAHHTQKAETSCGIGAEAGASRSTARLHTVVRVAVGPIVSIEPLFALAWARDEASRHSEAVGSARLGASIHVRIGTWGRGSARIDGGYDSLVRRSIAAHAGLDVALPAYRRSARRLLERDTSGIPADRGG